MNYKLINYKKSIVMSFIPFTDENEKQNWNLFDFRSDPRSGSADSDPYHN